VRFYENGSLVPWLPVAALCVYLFDVVRTQSFFPFWRVSLVAILILWILLCVVTHRFSYWEFDGTVVRQRRLWRITTIQCSEIMRVRQFGSYSRYMITYGRAYEDRSDIQANPMDRYGFISALRRFAPGIRFDVPDEPQACWTRDRR
jgi:hypothetical protein